MRRKHAIGADGRVEGLRVIGFHGQVDASHTPGRRDAIFVDTQGRLVGLEHGEMTPAGDRFVWVQVGGLAGEGPLQGEATRFQGTLPAYLDRVVVVVGTLERRHAEALRTIATHVEAPDVDSFVRWLAHAQEHVPEGMLVQRLGPAVAWYCRREDAYALYVRIGRVAEKEMIRAACRKDDRELYQLSWWRSRVALSDADRCFAAVGLERSNRAMSDTYLRAIFRKKTKEEVEAGLEHARRQFDALCAAEESQSSVATQRREPSSMETIIGLPVIRARRHVREQQTALPGKAA